MRQRRASRAPLTVSVLLFSSRLAATPPLLPFSFSLPLPSPRPFLLFLFFVYVHVSSFIGRVHTDTVPRTGLFTVQLSRFSVYSRENAFSVPLRCAWMKDDERRRRDSLHARYHSILPVFSTFHLARVSFPHSPKWLTDTSSAKLIIHVFCYSLLRVRQENFKIGRSFEILRDDRSDLLHVSVENVKREGCW